MCNDYIVVYLNIDLTRSAEQILCQYFIFVFALFSVALGDYLNEPINSTWCKANYFGEINQNIGAKVNWYKLVK